MSNRLQIPSKKFYPPRFAPDQCLYRGNLIEKELGQRGKNRQFFVIEAQAGQGKTTLIQQYLKRYDVPFFWYQFGEEDHDPVYFVTALLEGLSRENSTMALPQMELLLSAGRVSAGDLALCIDGIRQYLEKTASRDYYLVFDDLHLLANGGDQTLSLLHQFLSAAAPHLLFFLAARRPSGIDFSTALPVGQLLRLKNEQMALTLAETEELYRSVFRIDIPGTVLREIHAMTGGWAMGLVSFARSIEQAGADADLTRLLDLPRARERYQEYFRQEVFGQVPDHLKESLLLLSLLDEIPVPLAERLTGMAAIGEELAGLQARNLFLRTLDDQGGAYGMHHLFSEYLRARATRTLDRARLMGVYRQAAAYYLGVNALSTALDYYVRGEDWQAVEGLLEREGMTFIARSQTRTLALLLEKIPDEVRAGRGWLLFFAAITDNERVVLFSLEKLERAKCLFEESGQRKGTLLAIAQIIWLHMASTGMFHEGRKLVASADQLFEAIRPELSVDECVMVCRNIGAGALLFDFDIEISGKYLSRGEMLARDHRLSGHLNFILIFQAYILLFTGKTREGAERFEEIYPHFYSKQIGVIGKLGILTLEMNLLESLREVEVYHIRKRRIPEHLTRQQMFSFILGPYLILWGLDLDVVTGNLGRAVQVLEDKRQEIGALNPQYQSQILRNLAFLFSLNGERDMALALLKRANALRCQVGGRYFVAYHRIFAGATYAQCGLADRARVELDEAIASFRAMGNTFMLASAFMHRAWLSWQVEREPSAALLQDLAEAINLSLINDVQSFRTVPPGIVEPLLSLAVRQGIHPQQTRTLIHTLLRKGVTAQGKLVPLLELKFLGGVLIRYGGQVVCRSEDLSYLQRELLALLVAMPGQQISQEQVQGLLWPESSGEKARGNLDTLLSRLRASLATGVPKQHIKHYLSLQRGLLSLRHCAIDILDFQREARQGLAHLAARRVWKAENCFLKAMAVWQGPFAPEIFGVSEQVLFCRSEQLFHYSTMTRCWGDALHRMGRTGEAIDLLRAALSFLPTDDRMVRQLYHLLHEVSFQQAAKLLTEYREALRREEYSAMEVDAIIVQVAESCRRA